MARRDGKSIPSKTRPDLPHTDVQIPLACRFLRSEGEGNHYPRDVRWKAMSPFRSKSFALTNHNLGVPNAKYLLQPNPPDEMDRQRSHVVDTPVFLAALGFVERYIQERVAAHLHQRNLVHVS